MHITSSLFHISISRRFDSNDEFWLLHVYSSLHLTAVKNILHDSFREFHEAEYIELLITGADLLRVLRRALTETTPRHLSSQSVESGIYGEFINAITTRTPWLRDVTPPKPQPEEERSRWDSFLTEEEVIQEADEVFSDDFDILCLGTNEPEEPDFYTVRERYQQLKKSIRNRPRIHGTHKHS